MKANSEVLPNSGSRKPVQLQNVKAEGGQKKAGPAQIVYDLRKFSDGAASLHSMLQRLPHFSYTGVMMGPEHVSRANEISPALQIFFAAESIGDLPVARSAIGESRPAVIVSKDTRILKEALSLGFGACLHQFVDDGESLHRSIHLGKDYGHLMIHFRDPTNIPLELVIASLQATNTTLLKEIGPADDVDDAVVSLGVMEVGADGVVYSPKTHAHLEAFAAKMGNRRAQKMALEAATVTQSVPIGMGFRSCLDLATLFLADEGMLVGSTSQGGILCCPEVFFLPYMETRPFRVNAGGVHSYVYNSDNRTDYMSELKAGSTVLVVGLDGSTRVAPVGRVKTEMRPLRLIEASFESGERINVIMQDDWHVRVFSPTGEPLNVTELKSGDRVMAYKASPGRHVGIKVVEKIMEN